MNRVNILCTLALVGLLVVPSLSLPADPADITTVSSEPKDPSSNEISKDISKEGETFDPEQKGSDESTSVESTDVEHHLINSQSTGIITRVGYEGQFECRKICCPNGTETCEYNSKSVDDGKNCEVKYKCLSHNGTILHEETKIEPADQTLTGVDGFDISQFFDEMRRVMGSFIRNPFNAMHN